MTITPCCFEYQKKCPFLTNINALNIQHTIKNRLRTNKSTQMFLIWNLTRSNKILLSYWSVIIVTPLHMTFQTVFPFRSIITMRTLKRWQFAAFPSLMVSHIPILFIRFATFANVSTVEKRWLFIGGRPSNYPCTFRIVRRQSVAHVIGIRMVCVIVVVVIIVTVRIVVGVLVVFLGLKRWQIVVRYIYSFHTWQREREKKNYENQEAFLFR